MNDRGASLRFEAGGRALLLPASLVREVRRPARLTRVPHMPDTLLGVAKLRGIATPVLSAARLLSLEPGPEQRLILIEKIPPVAIAVDRVDRVEHGGETDVLDLDALVAQAMGGAATTGASPRGTRVRSARQRAAEDLRTILAFTIGHQSFGMPLAAIAAVMPRPRSLALFPQADAVVSGSIGWRDRVLPVLSLARLLGLPDLGRTQRLLVVRVAGSFVGLLVDAIEAVLHVPESEIDPVPVALSRGSAETRIEAIVRRDGGRRLLSLLSPDTLLRDDIVETLRGDAGQGGEEMIAAEAPGDPFLIFDIGAERFGLPLGVVSEILTVPERLTAVPRAPAFLLGIFSRRGIAIPLIDLATRLGTALTGRGQVILLRLDDVVAGLKVDRVRGIERTAAQLAPHASVGASIVERTIFPGGGEAVALILDPRLLLDQIERSLLLGDGGAGRG